MMVASFVSEDIVDLSRRPGRGSGSRVWHCSGWVVSCHFRRMGNRIEQSIVSLDLRPWIRDGVAWTREGDKGALFWI